MEIPMNEARRLRAGELRGLCRSLNIGSPQGYDHIFDKVVLCAAYVNSYEPTNLSDKALEEHKVDKAYCPATKERLGCHHVNIIVTEKSATKSCTTEGCVCPCDCCRTGTVMEEHMYGGLREQYRSLYAVMESVQDSYVEELKRSWMPLEDPYDELVCESTSVYSKKKFSHMALLKDNKCGNKLCTCICKCCLQHPIDMSLKQRIAFEHWLYYADKVRLYDMTHNTNILDLCNPLSLGLFYSYYIPRPEADKAYAQRTMFGSNQGQLRKIYKATHEQGCESGHELHDIRNIKAVNGFIVKICCICVKYVVVKIDDGKAVMHLW